MDKKHILMLVGAIVVIVAIGLTVYFTVFHDGFAAHNEGFATLNKTFRKGRRAHLYGPGGTHTHNNGPSNVPSTVPSHLKSNPEGSPINMREDPMSGNSEA